MAELVTSLVSPIMEELGKTILERVKRQLNYLCCFDSNIQNLREEAENLKNERDDLQRRVDAAHRNTDVTSSVVRAWITDSKKIQDYTNGIEDEIKNAKSGCLAIKSRFLLSRKARNTADAIKIHRENGKFEPEEICVPGLPASMAPIPQGPSEEFDSRKKIENMIMEDLRGRKVHMMGICGMGGVGKTTMAERIMNRVRDENLFEEVAMIVISQEVRKLEIQREIAEKFGMEKLEEESLSARAHKLHKRLTDATRKLLILDDIWKELDLKSLGIPCKSDEKEGCTILLTSRDREVLSYMNAKPFGMQILTEEEALFLFREKVGTCAEPEEVVKEVVKECKGLPLALVTVGTALKDKSSKHWNDALRKLKSSIPNIPKVLEKVYEPIKVSYDFLDNPDARSLFLLCCLFPEDCDIDLELLMIYGMGLRMFTADEITTLEEARVSVHVLVDRLKSCFLLLDGSDKNHVKMHDVVRDVAIFIASEEGRIVRKLTTSGREESINCKWISVVGEEINKLPIWLGFPSLCLLKIHNYSAGVKVNTDLSFFQGMTEQLNVLSFRGISFGSLPETTQLLKNLRTLYLHGCTSLETISIVGELLNLEILICHWCSSIAELPVEIGRLEKLRMLEVRHCMRLKRIAPGVISNLVQLEELIIVNSFNEWKTKANREQRENAALCEIKHLKNLTRLEIDIEDPTLAAEEIISFPSKIVKFAVTVGARDFSFYILPYERKMRLSCEGDITFGKWIHALLTSSEYLAARGECANNLDISQAQKMKYLVLYGCSKVNKLVNITPSMDWSGGVFPLLESLKLYALHNLEEICVGPIPKSSNFFGNLREIDLWECSKLRKLFPLLITIDDLQLETLEIDMCVMMEQVFYEMDREECQKITFPKLKSLKLSRLSSLISFYKGSASIEFPFLQSIYIEECGKLKSLSSSNGYSGNLLERDDYFHSLNHVFVNQKVIFHNLTEIDISHCHGIRILFPSSTAVNLVKLKKLKISQCEEMVKVIEDEDEDDDDDVLCEKYCILFPSLKELGLFDLPKLQIFCNWRCELDLPSLESVKINWCPLLEFFTMKSVLFPCLKSLEFYSLPKLQSFGNGRCEFELTSLESIQISYCPLFLEFFTMKFVGFHSLKEIRVHGCNNNRSLFLFSVAKTLVNLKELEIITCREMVKVIEDDDDISCEKPLLLFPCLKELLLEGLPKLECFCNWKCDIQLFPVIGNSGY